MNTRWWGGLRINLHGEGVLDGIFKGTQRARTRILAEVADIALNHAFLVKENMDEEVKGKINVYMSPAGPGAISLRYAVNREPAVRINQPVNIGGKVKQVKERPSIDTYVNRKLRMKVAEVSALIRAGTDARVNALVYEAYKYYGVDVNSAGRFFAPSGGIVRGGKIYGGGAYLPSPK